MKSLRNNLNRRVLRQISHLSGMAFTMSKSGLIASGIVILKDLSPGRIRQVTVLLVHSLKFTYVKLEGPNKQILT